MDYGQAMRTALRSLLVNKARFLQTMLAMVVGVAAVVVILGVCNLLVNFNTKIYDEFSPALFNTWIEVNAELEPKRITPADLEQAVLEHPDVIKAVSPVVYFDFAAQLRNDDKIIDDVYISGVGDNYLDMRTHWYLQEGRFLQYMDIERENRVCVVDSEIAAALFDGDALGKTVKIWGENFTVVGVLAKKPGYEFEDVELFMTYTNARKMVGENIRPYNYYKDQYLVLANGVENMRYVEAALTETLEKRTGTKEGTVWVNGTWAEGTVWNLFLTPFSYISNLRQGSIYTYIYFGLLAAAVVLFIGGVGIMNIMLAAVQERTREIGIRKAFGATNKDIKRQFTFEAVITSITGGLLGLLAGVAATLFLAIFEINVPINGSYPYPVRFEDMSLLTFGLPAGLVVLLCVGIGVFFGSYPAQQAAKMEPVAAINAD